MRKTLFIFVCLFMLAGCGKSTDVLDTSDLAAGTGNTSETLSTADDSAASVTDISDIVIDEDTSAADDEDGTAAGTKLDLPVVPEGVLSPKSLASKDVPDNPYMAKGASIIHNDSYSSDVTDSIMPLGIYPEVNAAQEIEANNAPPCFFYDSNGRKVTPYSITKDGQQIGGGVAIRDVDAPGIETLGRYLPAIDEPGAGYGMQISYAFVDNLNHIVSATTHGHIVMFKTTAEDQTVLPVFEKVLDVDVLSLAYERLGEDIDPNVMSVTMDYDGNIWCVTGGFHKNPEHSQDGFIAYIPREYIDRTLAGEQLSTADYVQLMRLEGENCENGISSHPLGCTILTNRALYLLHSENGAIQIKWRTEYGSNGGKKAPEESGITGAGLAWGGGASPSLSNELALFTDNLDPVNLIAVNMVSGEIAAQIPVLDELGENAAVSIENSINVYDWGESFGSGESGRVSVLVFNWLGAGNAKLYEEGSDSSVQLYSNLYDENWIEQGSKMLMPGIERVDFIKDEQGIWSAESVWTRDDICDTSMMKLSTATGYIYGYTQLPGSDLWSFMALDFETGETVMDVAVSDAPDFNNMAVGMMSGLNGNTVYCPTNNQMMLRLQDRFAYVADFPDTELDINQMGRAVLTTEQFQEQSNTQLIPATYLHWAEAEGSAAEFVFRVNGLSSKPSDYSLFVTVSGEQQNSLDMPKEWTLTGENGTQLDSVQTLNASEIYEMHIPVEDGCEWDLNADTGEMQLKVILAEAVE